ncbi:hypothetical protein J2T20_000459 [Paenibacillus wynnii]|nr:hypothetical protein [Paenibacillus wynnii]
MIMKKSKLLMTSIVLACIFSKLFLKMVNFEYHLFDEKFDFFRLFFDITIFLLFYVIVYNTLNFSYSKSQKKY